METLSNEKKIIPEDLITSKKFLRLEILRPSKKFCGKPDNLYPTRYPELFIKIIDGGFRLETGLKLALKSTMKPYDQNLTPYQNSEDNPARINENRWNMQGRDYPPGTLSYHFPEPGAKQVTINKTQVLHNNKKGYMVSGDNHLDINGCAFTDYRAQNAKEFGFIDYEAHVNLKLNYTFNNV